MPKKRYTKRLHVKALLAMLEEANLDPGKLEYCCPDDQARKLMDLDITIPSSQLWLNDPCKMCHGFIGLKPRKLFTPSANIHIILCPCVILQDELEAFNRTVEAIEKWEKENVG